MPAECSRERTYAVAEQAINQIRALKLPFDPPMFELWFTYYAGPGRALRAALDQLITEDQNPSYEALSALYEALVSPARLIDRVRGIGNDLQEKTNETLCTITSAAKSTYNFYEEITQVTQELGETRGTAEMKSTVSSLLKSTEEAQRKSAMLQRQLSDSFDEVRKLKDRLDIIQREAMSDPLTELANRRMFESSLCSLIKKSDEQHTPVSLILIDIDNFKYFNDEYGHRVGDDVLRLVSSLIEQDCRADDIVCRYGGDEFAVILPFTPIEEALVVAEKLRQSIVKRRLHRRSTQEAIGRLTVSVGAAQSQKGDSPEKLVARADKWLYSAKRSGRNCVNSAPDCLNGTAVVDIDGSPGGLQWGEAYECGDPR